MKIQHKKSRPFAQAILSAFVLAGAAYGTTALAADHRDSLAVDAIPEGDLADVFAYVDPANNSNVVLAMAVNPFTNPSEGPSVRFGQDLLYQFKIDNNQNNGAAEDTVIQINFHGGSNERAAQTYDVVIGTPSHTGPLNQRLYNARTLCSGTVFLGSANPTPTRAGAITSSSGTSCFAGLEDDSFQTDVAQAVFRIGLNPDPVANAANHSQDLFRGYAGTQSLIGGLRGRPLRLDGTSGVDGFGGYSTTSIVLSVPSNLLRGGGIRNVAKSGAVDSSLIGVWATVSRPTSETFNGFDATHGQDYAQFERMGQELFNTVFGFAKLPNGAKAAPLTYGETGLAPPAGASASTALSTAQIKDLINARGPETDVQLFDRLFPDSLTTTPTAGSASTGLGGLISALSGKLLGGNTVAGRASLLTVLGFNSLGITGTPLLLPQIGLSGNTNRRLLAQLSVPDYLRLNLDVPTDGVRAGAATSGNDSATLGIAKWGIQNGRRPADDVTDIILRLNRELDDVQFPANVVLPGIADAIPGSSDLADRAALSCTQLDVAGGLLNNLSVGSLLGALDANGLQALLVKPGASDGLLGKYTLNILTPCEDARIFAVLQGTDWIESNPLDVINVANQVSDQRALDATFPYMGFNPVPGETGTNAFPPQK